MSIPTDEELQRLYQTLPQQWFMIEPSRIHFYEKFAQGTPKNSAIHKLLVFYFHLSGDAEKCAFYALHGGIDVDDYLIKTSIETACLDYVIYMQGGGVHGSACIAMADENEFNYTKTRTRTVAQEQRKPFYMMEQLDIAHIYYIVARIVERSTPESQVSWKVHSKTLQTEELIGMSGEYLEMVFSDVQHHTDAIYRESMLKKLLQLYYERGYLKNAVDCLIQLRSTEEITNFFVTLINAEYFNEALQTAFSLFEEAPQNIVNDAIYSIKQANSRISAKYGIEVSNLISEKVLTGYISTSLYGEFVRKNYNLDKVALRKISQANNTTMEQLSAYSLMLMLMTLSTCYYEHRGNLIEKQRFYPRLGYYAQIGLVYRGANRVPSIYDYLIKNFASSNPYELGGVLFGLALQFSGLNTSEAAPFGLLMDINDNQLDKRTEEDRGPIIHGMAMAMGFIALGTHDEELVKIILEHFDTTDVDAKFAILLALGLVMLGNVEFFDSDIVNDSVKPFLACEHEKLRRGSALCLSLLCYRREQDADPIVSYLYNFAATSANQFSDSAVQLAPFALGLAHAQTGNIAVAYRLLLLANDLSRTLGAQCAIESIGFVFARRATGEGEYNSLLRLLTMCSKSFDAYIRAGCCRVLGQLFACSGHARAVELLCRMMGDQEEIVRCAAYVGQAFVLQTVSGVELPEAQTGESAAPVGDRQKSVFYRSDFASDEDFEQYKNQMKLYATPGVLSDRYKEIYLNKHTMPFTINQYATQFRRDLTAVALDAHDSGKETLLSVRAQMLALGVLNCGGLNMSFKQRTDLQIISYAIYLYAWAWYPAMGVLGLCMECDYVSTVLLENAQIQEMQLVLTIPYAEHEKYAYSALAKDTKHQDVEKYVKKARLSQSDLAAKNDQEQAEIIGGYAHITQMKDIAMQEFAQQANNVKLADALQQEEPPEKNSDEYKVMETPTRLVDQQVPHTVFIDGTDYTGVFPGVKRGIIVVKEVEYE